MSETGSDTRSGIGVRLRAGRERMGLTLLLAAERLHVDPKVVECLEAERFDALGAPVFVKGHLKRYSELVGEQAQELIDLYNAATKPALPDLTRLPKASPESTSGRLAAPSLVVLIGFVLVGVGWWIIQSMPASTEAEETAAAQAVSADSEIQVVPEELPPVSYPEQVPPAVPMQGAATGGTSPRAATTSAPGSGTAASTTSGSSTPSRTPGSATSASRAPTSTAPGSTTPGSRAPGSATPSSRTQGSGTAASTTPGTARPGASPPVPEAAGTASAPAGSTPPAPAAANTRMEVKLRFAADSWVEIYDSKGERLFADVGTADSERTISGTPPFRVTFGNAPGVSLDVNGKAATVPASFVTNNDTAQFTINRSGRIVRARPADGG